MKVTVTVDGEPQEVDVSFDQITLQQSVIVEQVLGVDGYDRWIASAGSGVVRPSEMRAILYSKLKARFPELDVTDFDVSTMTGEPDSGNDSGN